jgi:hypothetical protein
MKVAMTPADYAIDWALILVVLIQLRERRLTTTSLIRPFVIAGIAIVIYLRGIPVGGNDLELMAAAAAAGLLIGAASGQAVLMRAADGDILARSGWVSASFWILGMGSRFAFLIWITHGGTAATARFSAAHAITSKEAWTVALLAMAVAEVSGRSLVQAIRRHHLAHVAPHALARTA